MGTYKYSDYSKWSSVNDVPIDTEFVFVDHLNGFDETFKNPILDLLQQKFESVDVVYHNILDEKIHQHYNNLNLHFSADLQEQENFCYYNIANELANEPHRLLHFACTFNGSGHTSRELLTSAMHKFGWFFPNSTKNFVTDVNSIDGFIMEKCGENERFYRKFILTDDKFYKSIYANNYNNIRRYDHKGNILRFEKTLRNTFVHVVSETLATSYQPFVTEKVLYSIITKGLWLAYATPRYHSHLEKYYGFRKFSIFDYSFDNIANPVVRLVELLSSLSKFSKLDENEWHDLYLMEKDTINFNFDHYMSKSFLNVLRQYE